MDSDKKLLELRVHLEKLYNENQGLLLFHGWHHITFIAKKGREFAQSIGANTFLVESAGLVHDLNYIVEVNSEPEVGAGLRAQVLERSGYVPEEIEEIEKIIMSAHPTNRGEDATSEVKALSDADMLFKALPITPVFFTSKYIEQNKVDINKLSNKIVSEQRPLFEQEIYFYTDIAKEKYLHWAEGNLNLWINIEESLKDVDVQELLSIAKARGIL